MTSSLFSPLLLQNPSFTIFAQIQIVPLKWKSTPVTLPPRSVVPQPPAAITLPPTTIMCPPLRGPKGRPSLRWRHFPQMANGSRLRSDTFTRTSMWSFPRTPRSFWASSKPTSIRSSGNSWGPRNDQECHYITLAWSQTTRSRHKSQSFTASESIPADTSR